MYYHHLKGKSKTMKTVTCQMKELFHFFANKEVLPWSRSMETLFADLQEEIGINRDNAIRIFLQMKEIADSISDIYDKSKNETQNSKFRRVVKYAPRTLNEEFKKLQNVGKAHSIKWCYRISIPKDIYMELFIKMHSNILPSNITDKILPMISTVLESSLPSKLKAIKNHIAYNLLFKALELISDHDVDAIKTYYVYTNFFVLYNTVIEAGFIPKAYNPFSGTLYFSIPYKMRNKKEQIFDRIHAQKWHKQCKFVLEQVRLYIALPCGEIAHVRNLYDTTKPTSLNRFVVKDKLSFRIPNIIRKLMHKIVTDSGLFNYDYKYINLLSKIIRSNSSAADYCVRYGKVGDEFGVPLSFGWKTVNAKQLLHMGYTDINMKLLLKTYETTLYAIKTVAMQAAA